MHRGRLQRPCAVRVGLAEGGAAGRRQGLSPSPTPGSTVISPSGAFGSRWLPGPGPSSRWATGSPLPCRPSDLTPAPRNPKPAPLPSQGAVPSPGRVSSAFMTPVRFPPSSHHSPSPSEPLPCSLFAAASFYSTHVCSRCHGGRCRCGGTGGVPLVPQGGDRGVGTGQEQRGPRERPAWPTRVLAKAEWPLRRRAPLRHPSTSDGALPTGVRWASLYHPRSIMCDRSRSFPYALLYFPPVEIMNGSQALQT